jgi:hypothetical protein
VNRSLEELELQSIAGDNTFPDDKLCLAAIWGFPRRKH